MTETDKDAEIERLRTQLAKANKEIGILRDMLLNPDPDSEPDVIRLHREKCDMFDRAIAAELQLARARDALEQIAQGGNVAHSELPHHYPKPRDELAAIAYRVLADDIGEVR